MFQNINVSQGGKQTQRAFFSTIVGVKQGTLRPFLFAHFHHDFAIYMLQYVSLSQVSGWGRPYLTCCIVLFCTLESRHPGETFAKQQLILEAALCQVFRMKLNVKDWRLWRSGERMKVPTFQWQT
jgi:hypothetical protein